MKTIRNCVFETNSSSCHCVTMVNREDLNKLQNDKYVVLNFDRDIWEHEVFLETLTSDMVYSLEDATAKLRSQVVAFDPKGSAWKDVVKFMQDNWSTDLLEYILFPEDANNKFVKLQEETEDCPYQDELREVIKDVMHLDVDSYYTLFEIDEESGIADNTEMKLPDGNIMDLIDTEILC